ncbi:MULTISPECIES: sigma-70 family RNA polymerase sigma factor [unclassified Rhodococcus (in: high G+C Gram-positive bacteria)]|uniref:sigma-70 family RNA polymerase sigma factor n=1 Tax=unclassified Rhodococcus (in: high G+C Gram-positive bacteria) TaxID=192944 RepID=UPI0029531063|nr:sigma-70 family RNA polymerase sigma factor [Rhodococcus sp. IEGM 1318]MDV8003658.1 sigma-70 family RNA polymerase sigma factor [Rhodococcus sp. IEGM 1318]MDZ7912778.1 sigma-70 family RNA polymerase sigma factor [Rhodococcus sp. (in: high G+C Gram-positive bacteria)]
MHATVVRDEARQLFVSEPDHASDAAGACPTDNSAARTARIVESRELAVILANVAGGDQGAFAEFYDRTSSRVYGMVLRVLRDPGFSEEAVQEVYLQAWKSADSFDPAKGSALAWLLTLAHRRAVDRVRSEQSSSDRQALYDTTNATPEFDVVSDEVTRRDEHRAVTDCLETLTDTQRQSVTLAYYGGRTYREVAEDLGVAIPTIKSRIRDGLLRLRGCLGVM